MRSDPAPEAPTVSFQEGGGDLMPRPTQNRASEWFRRNRVARVPLIALEEDVYKVKGQNWVCFSMIKPEEYRTLHHNNRKYHGYLLKFRGCFESREAAEKHIHKVMAADKHFDIHLIPAFTWAGVEDDVVEDREYADQMIADIMKGYFEMENNRVLGIRERIRKTENVEEGFRGEEASQFFEESQQKDLGKSLPAIEEGMEPVTLSDLADEFGITPGAKARDDAVTLSRDRMEAIVSEVLLEDD